LMCYSFDIELDICSEVDIRSKVLSAFNHIVHSRQPMFTFFSLVSYACVANKGEYI